jgi:lauroyl/myristoyl acyltransferase
MLAVLAEGRPLGILPDFGTRDRGTRVGFLGGALVFPRGLERLARQSGAPIVVGLLRQATDASFVLSLTPHESPPNQTLADQLARALGAEISTDPANWLWMTPHLTDFREAPAKKS